jgi:hypothetical protein
MPPSSEGTTHALKRNKDGCDPGVRSVAKAKMAHDPGRERDHGRLFHGCWL